MKVAFNVTLPREDLDLLDGIMAAKRMNRSQAVHYLLMVAVKSLRDLQSRKQRFQREKVYAAQHISTEIVKPRGDMIEKVKTKTEQTKKIKDKTILP